MNRRTLLQGCVAVIGIMAFAPLRALAGLWNRAAFESSQVSGALQGLGVGQVGPSRDIVLTVPDLAENGAIVQVEVESRIPGTEAIAILAEKNPTPLIANFLFFEGAEPYAIVRIKMAETADVRAIVKAGGKYYSVGKKVEVVQGGCG